MHGWIGEQNKSINGWVDGQTDLSTGPLGAAKTFKMTIIFINKNCSTLNLTVVFHFCCKSY